MLSKDRLVPQRHSDLDPPGRHLGVFLLADEVKLRGPDVAVPRKFPHLVHLSPVPDGVVDRRLPERVNPNPPAVEPIRVDPGGPTVLCRPPDYADTVRRLMRNLGNREGSSLADAA